MIQNRIKQLSSCMNAGEYVVWRDRKLRKLFFPIKQLRLSLTVRGFRCFKRLVRTGIESRWNDESWLSLNTSGGICRSNCSIKIIIITEDLVHVWLSSPCSWVKSSTLWKSVQSLIHVQLFAIPWTAACQASLSITNSWSLLKLMSIKSVMPSNHLILCCPLLLPPSIFPSIRVFSNESVLRIRWPKYWSFIFSISPSNEYSGLISFRIDWLILQSKGLSRVFSNTTVLKHEFLLTQLCLWVHELMWIQVMKVKESESCSVLSNSLQPHVLYSPLNSPGQNTGVGRLSLVQESPLPRNWTGVSCTAGGFFTNWAIREAHYVSNFFSFTLLPLRT